MDPQDVEYAMFNKDFQRFELIIPSDEGIKTLHDLMGSDVSPRKDFVFKNINFSEVEI